MAFQTLQLGAAITSAQLSWAMTAVGGTTVLPAVGSAPLSYGVPCLIDGEFVYCVAQPVTGFYQFRGRGSEGTAATPHDILANVSASSTNDFGNPQPAAVVTIDASFDLPISLGQDQTVNLPGSNAVFNINKLSICNLAIGSSPASDNGVTYVFTSTTAFAHVITAATGTIKDGSGSSGRTTVTFAAVPGSTVTLVGENGFWNVVAQQNVTLA